MDHKRNFQDEELIRLLAGLEAATPEYPDDRLSKRRAAFLVSVSAITAGGALAAKVAAKQAGTALKGAMSQVDKVVLAVELMAVSGLAAYVGVTAYIHRDELKDLFFPPPVSTSVSTVAPVVEPISVTATPEGTPTPVVTGTVVPGGTLGPTPEPDQLPPPTQIQPTAQQPTDPPPPPTEPPPTRPGLHLGQTKTPEP